MTPNKFLIHVELATKLPGSSDGKVSYSDPFASVPWTRWDLEASAKQSKSTVRPRYGSWLEDVSNFDANLFGITAPEAELMDPQQRLILELAWQVSQVFNLQHIPPLA